LIVFLPGEEHWHGNKEDAEANFGHIHFLAQSKDGELEILDSP